jgi:hypothetical protein
VRAHRRTRTALAAVALAFTFAPAAIAKLLPLPHGWPKTLQIGLSHAPGGAAKLREANDVELARAFAQQWARLRERLAPNVPLAYHMSGWGTKHDIVYEDPPDATVRAYAAQSAAFYRALRTGFDVSFGDFSDRDAGFYEKVQGNPHTWFTPADFHRRLLYGATSWGRDRDNRAQWLLGDGGRARAYYKQGAVRLP